MSRFQSDLLTACVVAGACIAAIAVTGEIFSPSDYGRVIDPSRPAASPDPRRGRDRRVIFEELEPVEEESLAPPWAQ